MVRSSRTGFAVALAVALAAGVVHAQSVDEIIARNLKARGGADKLRATTSVKVTGDVAQQGTKIHIVTYTKRPNFIRREMEGMPPPPAPGRATMPGMPSTMKAVMASDGNTVWMINPMIGNGPQQITGPQAEMAKGDPDFDSVLLDYKEKGHTIELVGTETINGKPAYHLKITRKNGLVQQCYLDVETALEVRTQTAVDQGGVKTEVVTDLSNYQTVEGLTIPFTMKQSVNGKPIAEVTVTKWEVNVPMDDEMFRMPARK